MGAVGKGGGQASPQQAGEERDRAGEAGSPGHRPGPAPPAIRCTSVGFRPAWIGLMLWAGSSLATLRQGRSCISWKARGCLGQGSGMSHLSFVALSSPPSLPRPSSA